MKKGLFVVIISAIAALFFGCVSSTNQAVIDEFVSGANEEFVLMGDIPGIKSSVCEYRDGSICFDYVLDLTAEGLQEINSETLEAQYLAVYQANMGSDAEYAEVFKALSEEGCMIEFRFSSSDGSEICFEIDPKDIIKE